MKSIEERATEYADRHKETEYAYFGASQRYCYTRIYNAELIAYDRGAKEQRKIDIDKACNIFCHIGCPHENDDYDCLKDKCTAWKKFRKKMEE